MENSKKQLKIASYLVLILGGISLVQFILGIVFFKVDAGAVAGANEQMIMITKIVLMTVSGLILLPRLYIGLKGLKVAKIPNSSRAHIVWAIILLVIAVLNLISVGGALIQQQDVGTNVGLALDYALDVLVFLDYIKYANEVAKAA